MLRPLVRCLNVLLDFVLSVLLFCNITRNKQEPYLQSESASKNTGAFAGGSIHVCLCCWFFLCPFQDSSHWWNWKNNVIVKLKLERTQKMVKSYPFPVNMCPSTTSLFLASLLCSHPFLSFLSFFQIYLRWPAKCSQALYGKAGCADQEPWPRNWEDVQFSSPRLRRRN